MRNPLDYFRTTKTETAEDAPTTETPTEPKEDPEEPEDNGLTRYMEAHETTREYTEPILLEEPDIRRENPLTSTIASTIESAKVQPIDIEFPTLGTNANHIDLSLSSTVKEEGGSPYREVTITLEISEFTKWAADSRLEEVEDGVVDEMFSMNGPYYVKLQGEIEDMVREAVGRNTLFFNVVEYDEETDTAIATETVSLSAYDEQW